MCKKISQTTKESLRSKLLVSRFVRTGAFLLRKKLNDPINRKRGGCSPENLPTPISADGFVPSRSASGLILVNSSHSIQRRKSRNLRLDINSRGKTPIRQHRTAMPGRVAATRPPSSDVGASSRAMARKSRRSDVPAPVF